MWRNSLRDLQWRWRRFSVALLGAALVFASTLLMAGLADSFREEVDTSVGGFAADGWVVRSGGGGPFTSFRLVPESTVTEIARTPGVERADPLIFIRQSVGAPELVDVNLIGFEPGAIGEPPVAAGRPPRSSGEAAVDETVGVGVGGDVKLEGRDFCVVGVMRLQTLFAGSPNVYVPMRDVQRLLLYGQRMANVIVVRGHPASLPEGFRLMSTEEVVSDVLRPLGKAVAAIVFAQRILWFVAAFIIGAVVYTSALERTRDFAVFKATGVSSRHVLGGLALQAVLVSVGAATLAIGVSRILVPFFPLHVTFPVRAVPLLFGEAIVVGIVASLFGARRALSADPALAFAGP